MTSGRDRRQHDRIASQLTVVVNDSGSRHSYHFTKDVSEGGIFVIARDAPSVGSEIDMELRIGPQGARLKARGLVVRDETGGSQAGCERGFAVAFTRMPEPHAAQLVDFLNTLLEDGAPQRATA